MDIRQTNQAELSRKLGWSDAKLSRLINGKQKGVTVAQLKELEAALGISLAFLMDIEDVAQTDDERALLAGYRQAALRDKELARAAVEPRD
jgi:transcriptional regulator with XRE-family HTH domain